MTIIQNAAAALIASSVALTFATSAQADLVPACAAKKTAICWIESDSIHAGKNGGFRITTSCFHGEAGKLPSCHTLIIPVPQAAKRVK